MLNRKKLMKYLKKDINNVKLYKLKYYLIKILSKSVIVTTYVLPMILSLILTYYVFCKLEANPFKYDKVEKNEKIETINTSSGFNQIKINYDIDYNTEIFEHSTGWIKNEYGLYERTVTNYKYDKALLDGDIESLLSSSKESIDKRFQIINVSKVQKDKLDSEDMYYDEDMFIVVRTSKGNTITEFQSEKQNDLDIGLYAISSIILGVVLLIIVKPIREKINEKTPAKLTKKELQKMKYVLKLKKRKYEII